MFLLEFFNSLWGLSFYFFFFLSGLFPSVLSVGLCVHVCVYFYMDFYGALREVVLFLLLAVNFFPRGFYASRVLMRLQVYVCLQPQSLEFVG